MTDTIPRQATTPAARCARVAAVCLCLLVLTTAIRGAVWKPDLSPFLSHVDIPPVGWRIGYFFVSTLRHPTMLVVPPYEEVLSSSDSLWLTAVLLLSAAATIVLVFTLPVWAFFALSDPGSPAPASPADDAPSDDDRPPVS